MKDFLPFSSVSRAWEPKARALRRLAGVRSGDRLDPWKLAPKVGLCVVDGHAAMQKIKHDVRSHLLGPGRNGWSGGVYPDPLPDGRYLCILNPTHSERRNKITLMEEIVHIHLDHRPTRLVCAGDGVNFRDYDDAQETDAYGIGAACLLPWDEFFMAVNSGRAAVEIADIFEVTSQLVEYRIKLTGTSNLYRARQRRRA